MTAHTGSTSIYGADQNPYWGENPKLTLHLLNNGKYSAELTGYKGYDSDLFYEFLLSSAFTPPLPTCVTQSDIIEVSLDATGGDGWFVTSIYTYRAKAGQTYIALTSDPTLNKWVDINEAHLYPYNAKSIPLTLNGPGESLPPSVNTDIPECGYGVQVCECKESAEVCVFNLEIDEIMTFTSYQTFEVGKSEGLYVRGTQGVVFNIKEDSGQAEAHPAYSKRKCAELGRMGCSNPQFVDGKTYRMAIGVNGQIPGPTLIVHDGQKVVIHVHNNMSSEGISIHWHGMFQMGTPWMDGVGQVTQCQIGPSSSYTYMYKASPSGTFWYHSHSGAQRTDGFFGALIVREKTNEYNDIKAQLALQSVSNFEDLPGEHSITLLDWQHEASLATFSQLNAGLGFYPALEIGEIPESCAKRYESTRSIEAAEVGPVPYFSGLINGKGRHSDVPYSQTRLSVFTVEQGKRYRFRLIGAQGLYAYKFSIDGHKLTVLNTDGYWILPQKNVDYIIIHTGERYDFILEANAEFKNYWMQAETLEINRKGTGPPYLSRGHVAEAILQYKQPGQDAPPISSIQYESIKRYSPAISCTSNQRCRAINCPFQNFHSSYNIDCTNVGDLRLLIPTPQNEMPQTDPTCGNCRQFINFNFEGDSETSSVNGRNFILPPVPPQTQNDDFQKQAIKCDRNANCNPSSLSCMCTHIIDIPYQQTIQFVLSALGAYDNAHPIHLHGHTFHVVKVGYPDYDKTTGFIKKTIDNGKEISVHNRDIACDDKQLCANSNDPDCNPYRCTKPRWSGGTPSMSLDTQTIRKDTVMVPAGGYVVINFKSDNPGHWFLHCHIEVHQLEGMAVIINEAPDKQKDLPIPENINKCGDFILTMSQYEKLYDNGYLALQQSYDQ